ncbi:putative Dilute domain-containing protein [Helianthus annuus]|nr:putative Dilute domain-containing protein [Helianthus annuus]
MCHLSLLLHKECCTFANAEYVKAGLSKLEVWCSKVTAEVFLQAFTIIYRLT